MLSELGGGSAPSGAGGGSSGGGGGPPVGRFMPVVQSSGSFCSASSSGEVDSSTNVAGSPFETELSSSSTSQHGATSTTLLPFLKRQTATDEVDPGATSLPPSPAREGHAVEGLRRRVVVRGSLLDRAGTSDEDSSSDGRSGDGHTLGAITTSMRADALLKEEEPHVRSRGDMGADPPHDSASSSMELAAMGPRTAGGSPTPFPNGVLRTMPSGPPALPPFRWRKVIDWCALTQKLSLLVQAVVLHVIVVKMAMPEDTGPRQDFQEANLAQNAFSKGASPGPVRHGEGSRTGSPTGGDGPSPGGENPEGYSLRPPLALALFYGFYMGYLALSCLQLKYDTRTMEPTISLTRSLSMPSKIFFTVYCSTPFIAEFRVLCDWVATKTCLDLFMWFKLEDAYNNLYFTKYDMSQRKLHGTSRPRQFLEKFFSGFCFLVLLTVLLIGPLYYFSSLNTLNRVTAEVASGKVELRLSIFVEGQTVPRSVVLYESNQAEIAGVDVEVTAEKAVTWRRRGGGESRRGLGAVVGDVGGGAAGGNGGDDAGSGVTNPYWEGPRDGFWFEKKNPRNLVADVRSVTAGRDGDHSGGMSPVGGEQPHQKPAGKGTKAPSVSAKKTALTAKNLHVGGKKPPAGWQFGTGSDRAWSTFARNRQVCDGIYQSVSFPKVADSLWIATPNLKKDIGKDITKALGPPVPVGGPPALKYLQFSLDYSFTRKTADFPTAEGRSVMTLCWKSQIGKIEECQGSSSLLTEMLQRRGRGLGLGVKDGNWVARVRQEAGGEWTPRTGSEAGATGPRTANPPATVLGVVPAQTVPAQTEESVAQLEETDPAGATNPTGPSSRNKLPPSGVAPDADPKYPGASAQDDPNDQLLRALLSELKIMFKNNQGDPNGLFLPGFYQDAIVLRETNRAEPMSTSRYTKKQSVQVMLEKTGTSDSGPQGFPFWSVLDQGEVGRQSTKSASAKPSAAGEHGSTSALKPSLDDSESDTSTTPATRGLQFRLCNARVTNPQTAAAAAGSAATGSNQIIAIYVGIVFVIWKLIRGLFASSSQRVIYEELERTDLFEDICNGVYIAR